ncbi:MAG: hypothetical protein AMXMBFR47_08790 [Planctomycetota bacterium]
MNTEQTERYLASMPVATPDPAREAALLDAIRTAEQSGTALSLAPRPVWWRRPVPLWQAAAAVVTLAIVDLAWLRPPAEPPAPAAPALAVRVEAELFSRVRNPGEPIDVSRWGPRPALER